MKDVDLGPGEWASERPKPKEPFLGSGVKTFLFYVASYGTGIVLFGLAKMYFFS